MDMNKDKKIPKKTSRRTFKKSFLVPIYDVKVWIVLTDDIVKDRKKLSKEVGESNNQDDIDISAGLCVWNMNVFAILIKYEYFDFTVLAHEIFHLTHRILEWTSSNFDDDHHETAAMLNGYLFKEITKRLPMNLMKKD